MARPSAITIGAHANPAIVSGIRAKFSRLLSPRLSHVFGLLPIERVRLVVMQYRALSEMPTVSAGSTVFDTRAIAASEAGSPALVSAAMLNSTRGTVRRRRSS